MHGLVLVVDVELVLENESSVEMLEFLTQNAFTVANTLFPKKRLHLQTWQHPWSKLWHCKDFAIVRTAVVVSCIGLPCYSFGGVFLG